MNIKKVSIFLVDLPMKVAFTTGFGTISTRPTVIVKLETSNGVIGWGESAALDSPIYNAEDVYTALHVIKDCILPRLLNHNVTLEEYAEETKWIRGNRIARFGVECALWDIHSQEKGVPISVLIGGKRQKVAVGESVGIQAEIIDTLKIIEKRLGEGYQRIKIKIRPGWDLNIIKAIRKVYPKIPLMVDANSAYTLKDIYIFQKLDEYNLMMIEQPLADDDIVDHAKIQKMIKTPICLDESIENAEDARKAIELGSCKIINVKPGRVGGLMESKLINDLAKKHHIPLWCGGMLESGIAKPFNMAAASLSEFSLPADMSPSDNYFKESITSPDILVSKGGFIGVPSVTGLGFKVSEKLINKYTKEKYNL